MSKEVFTVTFGDQAENHVGMEKIGKLADEGFNHEELLKAQKMFSEQGFDANIINLTEKLQNTYTSPEPSKKQKNQGPEEAYILVVKKGVDALLKPIKKTHNDLYKEHKNIKYDTQAFMYGRVVNKSARYNVCFNNKGQKPDIKNGKGTIIAFSDVPVTNYIRGKLPNYLGKKAKMLLAEGNHYFDLKKCGIGFHGDAERMKVIGIRVGTDNIPIHYQWYFKGEPVGDRIIIDLEPGDMYVMCEKTTGNDWRKKSIYTLRHATGAAKFTTIKPKKVKLPVGLAKQLSGLSEAQIELVKKHLEKKK